MIDVIIIFERQPTGDTEQLYPFSLLHPSFELRLGAFKQYEKIAHAFPSSSIHFTSNRIDILSSFHARYGYVDQGLIQGHVLVLFGDILYSSQTLRTLVHEIKHGLAQGLQAFRLIAQTNNEPLGYFLHNPAPTTTNRILDRCIWEVQQSLPCNASYPRLNNLWDIFPHISTMIADDRNQYEHFHIEDNPNHLLKLISRHVHVIEPDNVFIAPTATIAPMTVLDAKEGAIIIDDGATIMPMTSIIGPCYIGKNSIVRAGSTLYHDTVIGERCKVGGEIENAIMQGYANKQHYGFMGHSFLGEWVNLGAGTTTSDLKNNYGDIRIKFAGREVNSGRMFLGLLCGDHSKAAINTTFSTGTVVGISSNIFGFDYPERFVQSFSWGGHKDSTIFDITQAIAIAQRVMARRNKQLLPEEEALLRKEFASVISQSD